MIRSGLEGPYGVIETVDASADILSQGLRASWVSGRPPWIEVQGELGQGTLRPLPKRYSIRRQERADELELGVDK